MKIFEPIQVGPTTLKNRLARSATWLAACPEGEITEALIERHVELAKGGCGLAVTGFAFIAPEGGLLPAMIGVESDERVAGLRRLTDRVHHATPETKIFCQLVHTGIWRLPFVRTTYADTFAADQTKDPFIDMGGTGETCPAATEEQINEVIGKWAAAARRCQDAGFDGVELHFAHGFGAAGWISPAWNHRTDRWGGSQENRARYGVEVVNAVRSAIGDWPVIAKINSTDGIEGGIEPPDVDYFAKRLVEAGIDGLVVSGGCPASGPKDGPSRLARVGKEGSGGEGYFAAAAGKVRAAIGGDGASAIPIFGVGGWRTTAMMQEHLGRSCDAFALSRPLLNDPDLINKWIDNPDHLTSCVSCSKCMQGAGIVVCRKDD